MQRTHSVVSTVCPDKARSVVSSDKSRGPCSLGVYMDGSQRRYTGLKSAGSEDFPGGPGVRTPSFHCRGRRFDPQSGN